MVGGTITAFVLKVSPDRPQTPTHPTPPIANHHYTSTNEPQHTHKAVPGQLSPGDFFVDDSDWEVPAPASHDTVRYLIFGVHRSTQGLTYMAPTYQQNSSRRSASTSAPPTPPPSTTRPSTARPRRAAGATTPWSERCARVAVVCMLERNVSSARDFGFSVMHGW